MTCSHFVRFHIREHVHRVFLLFYTIVKQIDDDDDYDDYYYYYGLAQSRRLSTLY